MYEVKTDFKQQSQHLLRIISPNNQVTDIVLDQAKKVSKYMRNMNILESENIRIHFLLNPENFGI